MSTQVAAKMLYNGETLSKELAPLIEKIVSHPVHESVRTLRDVRLLMSHHVFAVWDFMCLLKALYARIVCITPYWVPPRDAMAANLIGSILLDEESDVDIDGQGFKCHYDTYLAAMAEVGCDIGPISNLVELLKQGMPISSVIDRIEIQPCSKRFVQSTISSFEKPIHQLAAYFVFGREAITPSLFIPLIKRLRNSHEFPPDKVKTLIFYLERHIELDGDDHFPKALQMLTNLIDGSSVKYQEAKSAATKAMHARLDFLTSIQHALETS